MGSRQLVQIVSCADEDYCIALRGNASVVIALKDPRDPFQNWFKDEICKTKKDAKNQSAFALINEATEQAVTFDKTSYNLFAKDCYNREELTLWASKNMQLGSSIMCIHQMQDPSREFSVTGNIHEGSVVYLNAAENAKNHHWEIVPQKLFVEFNPTPSMNISQPTVTISCRVKEDHNLTICNDSVMVAPSNFEDKKQYWIKDMTYARHAKDHKSNRAFALVNKATGQAIKHGLGRRTLVRLVQFDPYLLDVSILWTEDVMDDDYSYIRMINNVDLVFDLIGGHKNGWVLLGQENFIRSHNWQQWKIKELK